MRRCGQGVWNSVCLSSGRKFEPAQMFFSFFVSYLFSKTLHLYCTYFLYYTVLLYVLLFFLIIFLFIYFLIHFKYIQYEKRD